MKCYIYLLALAAGLSLPLSAQRVFPTQPLTVADLSSDQVTVDWPAVPASSRPSHYSLQIRKDSTWATTGTVGGGGSAGTIDGLPPETAYDIRVLAHYADDSPSSQVLSIVTLRPFTGVFTTSVPASGPDTILADWQPQQGASGYLVEWDRLTGPSQWTLHPTFAGAQEIHTATPSQYQIPDLLSNAHYRVRVAALLPGDTRTGWSYWAIATTGLGTPDEFRVEGLDKPPGAGITLFWEAEFLGAGSHVDIERAAWGGDYFQIAEALPNQTVHGDTWEDTSVADGRFYTYRIRSQDGSGTLSGYAYDGTWSSRPDPPASPAADQTFDNQVHLSWDPIDGPAEYVIERYHDTGSAFDIWEEVGRTREPVFVDGLDSLSPLVPGGDYLYRIKADLLGLEPRGNDGLFHEETEFSALVSVTLPPAAPATVTATLATGGGTIHVDWTDVPGETGYEIERRVASLAGDFASWNTFDSTSAGDTSLKDDGLSANMRYQYRVRSISAAGASSWSESPVISSTPGIPVNVRVEVLSDTSIRVSWDEVSTADGYVVRRSDIDGTNADETTLSESSRLPAPTSVVLDGLSGFSRYLIRVKSTADRTESPYGQHVFTRTLASLTAGKQGSDVRLTWSDVAADPALDISHYRVERRQVSAVGTSSPWVEIADLQANLSGETYLDVGPAPDTTYQYRMRGWKPADGGTFTSYSVIDEVSFGPPPVTGFALDHACQTELEVSWDPVLTAEETRLLIRESGDPGFTTVETLAGAASSYRYTGLTPGTSYTLWVFATNSRGENSSIQLGADTLEPLAAPAPLNPSFPLVTISAGAVSDTSIEVEWGEVPGSGGYRLERRLSPDGEWEPVADTAAGVTSWLDTGLLVATAYDYRAAGLDFCGAPGAWTPFDSTATTFTVTESWRVSHWGDSAPVRNGQFHYADDADFDQDGWPNIFEFWTDSLPNDAASRPAVEILVTGTEIRFTWPTRENTGGFTPNFMLTGDLVHFAPHTSVTGATLETASGTTTLVVPRGVGINGTGDLDSIFVRLEQQE
jgi:hypothetical protein